MTRTKTKTACGRLKMKAEDTGRERPAQDPAGAAKGQGGAGRRARGCDAPQPPPTQVVWWLRVDEIAPSPYQTRAEEADGVAALTESGKTAPEIAEMLGVSERWVFRRRKLSALLPEWRKIIAKKGAGQVFCERLAALPPAAQKALLKTDLKDDPDHDCIVQCLWRAGVRELERMPWAERRPEWCAGCGDTVDGAEIDDDDGFFDGKLLCGDPACLKRKLQKWVDERRAQAARDLPADAPPPIDVESKWHAPHDARSDKPDIKKGITQAYVITEGPEAGKLLWGKPPAADEEADEAPEIPGRREELARIGAVQALAREKAEKNEGGVSLVAALRMLLVYRGFFDAGTRDRRKRLEKAEAEICGPHEAAAFLLGLVAPYLEPYIPGHGYLRREKPPAENWLGEAE